MLQGVVQVTKIKMFIVVNQFTCIRSLKWTSSPEIVQSANTHNYQVFIHNIWIHHMEAITQERKRNNSSNCSVLFITMDSASL